MFKSLALPSLTALLVASFLLAAAPLLPARADPAPNAPTPAARPAPTHQELAELESMASQMEVHLAGVQEKLKLAAAKAPRLESAQAAVGAVIAPLSDTHDEEAVLTRLWRAVQQDHLKVKSVFAGKMVVDHLITELPLRIMLGGTVPDVLALVRKIEGPDWAVAVSALRLSSPDSAGNAVTSLSLTVLFAERDTKPPPHVVDPAELPRPAALDQLRQWLSGPAGPGLTERQAALEQRMEKLISENTAAFAGVKDLDGRALEWKVLGARAYAAAIARTFPPLYKVVREVSGSVPPGVSVDDLGLERQARPDHSVVLTMHITGLAPDASTAAALTDRLGGCTLLEAVAQAPGGGASQPVAATATAPMLRFFIHANVKAAHDLAPVIAATTRPADAAR